MLVKSLSLVNSERTKIKQQKSYNISFRQVETSKKQLKDNNYFANSLLSNQQSSFKKKHLSSQYSISSSKNDFIFKNSFKKFNFKRPQKEIFAQQNQNNENYYQNLSFNIPKYNVQIFLENENQQQKKKINAPSFLSQIPLKEPSKIVDKKKFYMLNKEDKSKENFDLLKEINKLQDFTENPDLELNSEIQAYKIAKYIYLGERDTEEFEAILQKKSQKMINLINQFKFICLMQKKRSKLMLSQNQDKIYDENVFLQNQVTQIQQKLYKQIKILLKVYKKEEQNKYSNVDYYVGKHNIEINNTGFKYNQEFIQQSQELIRFLYWTINRRDWWPIDSNSSSNEKIEQFLTSINKTINLAVKSDNEKFIFQEFLKLCKKQACSTIFENIEQLLDNNKYNNFAYEQVYYAREISEKYPLINNKIKTGIDDSYLQELKLRSFTQQKAMFMNNYQSKEQQYEIFQNCEELMKDIWVSLFDSEYIQQTNFFDISKVDQIEKSCDNFQNQNNKDYNNSIKNEILHAINLNENKLLSGLFQKFILKKMASEVLYSIDATNFIKHPEQQNIAMNNLKYSLRKQRKNDNNVSYFNETLENQIIQQTQKIFFQKNEKSSEKSNIQLLVLFSKNNYKGMKINFSVKKSLVYDFKSKFEQRKQQRLENNSLINSQIFSFEQVNKIFKTIIQEKIEGIFLEEQSEEIQKDKIQTLINFNLNEVYDLYQECQAQIINNQNLRQLPQMTQFYIGFSEIDNKQQFQEFSGFNSILQKALQEFGLSFESLDIKEENDSILSNYASLGVQAQSYEVYNQHYHGLVSKNSDIEVYFGGHTFLDSDKNRFNYKEWIPDQKIQVFAFDKYIPGYNSQKFNLTRFWNWEGNDSFIMNNYISDCEEFKDNLNDKKEELTIENLKKAYILVSASMQDIFLKQSERIKIQLERNSNQQNSQFDFVEYIKLDLDTQVQKVQQEDYLLKMLVPIEVLRILIDVKQISFENSLNIVRQLINADKILQVNDNETFPSEIFQKCLPRHLEIIKQLNFFYQESCVLRFEEQLLIPIKDKVILMQNVIKLCSNYMIKDSKNFRFQINQLGTNLREPLKVDGFYYSIEKYNQPLSDLISDSVCSKEWLADPQILNKIINDEQKMSLLTEQFIHLKQDQKLKLAILLDNKRIFGSYLLTEPNNVLELLISNDFQEIKTALESYILSSLDVFKNHQIQKKENENFNKPKYIFIIASFCEFNKNQIFDKKTEKIIQVISFYQQRYNLTLKNDLQIIFYPYRYQNEINAVIQAADISNQVFYNKICQRNINQGQVFKNLQLQYSGLYLPYFNGTEVYYISEHRKYQQILENKQIIDNVFQNRNLFYGFVLKFMLNQIIQNDKNSMMYFDHEKIKDLQIFLQPQINYLEKIDQFDQKEWFRILCESGTIIVKESQI